MDPLYRVFPVRLRSGKKFAGGEAEDANVPPEAQASRL